LKFKYLIIAFSIIIIFILLIIALLPSFLSNSEAAVNLRVLTLPLFIFMVLVLVCLGLYFLSNYRLLSLLEREDWPALAYFLEQKLYVKGRYNARRVQLLASSYMVISDYPSVLKLEGKAALAKPSVVEKNVMIFGSARVLSGDYASATAFFKKYLDKSKLKDRDREWIRWFYGFTQLLGRAFRQAEPEFLSLAESSSDAVIVALSAYFLDKNLAKYSIKPEECRASAQNGRGRVVEALKTAENWKKEVEKIENEIHISIVRKYVDEAGKWLFADNVSTKSVFDEEKVETKTPAVAVETEAEPETDTETL